MPLLNNIAEALSNFIHQVIALFKLAFRQVLSWFRDREELVQSDRDNVAFTIQEHLATGNYRTVQGVFNKRTNAMIDAAEYHTNEVDDQVAIQHEGKPLVIYT